MPGRLVILSGPSGVGKDTVIGAWKKIRPEAVRVVAYTTRDKREGETDGIDYHFVTPARFLEMVEEGKFLEWKSVHDNFYGTPQNDMQSLLDDGKVAILKIDVQGALMAMEKRPDAVSIFLLPPSMAELERRIRERRSDSGEVIHLRLQNANNELEYADKYQYRVVNDDLDRCAREIDELVMGGK